MRRLLPHRLETVDAGPYGSGPHPAWLDVDWSAHLRTLELGGTRVNLLDMGEGEPLLFVHGWSAGWQHWLEQVLPFSRTHRVLAVDLPGFGASAEPVDGELTITGYAATLNRLCGELGVDRVTVIGSSMGGFVGAELAIAFATRVQGLVLLAAAGLANRYIGLPTAVLRDPRLDVLTPAVLGGLGAPDPVLRALVTRPRGRELALGVVCAHPGRLHPALVYEIARLAGRPAAAKLVGELARYDFRERVGDIECPAMIVWGDTDRLVPVSGASGYAQRIQGSRKLLYRSTGHLPMLERPERFNADLQAFLDDASAAEAQ